MIYVPDMVREAAHRCVKNTQRNTCDLLPVANDLFNTKWGAGYGHM